MTCINNEVSRYVIYINAVSNGKYPDVTMHAYLKHNIGSSINSSDYEYRP